MIASQVLVFWTHVACIDTSQYLSQQFSISDKRSVEIALVGFECNMSRSCSDFYYGLIIERCQGFAWRNGVVHELPRSVWLAGNPKKELIVLM